VGLVDQEVEVEAASEVGLMTVVVSEETVVHQGIFRFIYMRGLHADCV
jgi:hypothetical protein